MRRILAVAALAGVAVNPSGIVQAASFDGNWNVMQDCETAPGGARGFKWTFDATVKEGRLLGQYGTKDKPASQTLSGRIQPDGSASLTASGVNGKSDYTLGFAQTGDKFSYAVSAHFDEKRGTGIRTQGRTCKFTFVKL
jgi:hypothetical protein